GGLPGRVGGGAAVGGFVVRTGDLFLIRGAMGTLARGETGLCHRDTRYLSTRQWTINGEVPRALHTWVEGAESRTVLGFPLSREGEVSPYAVGSEEHTSELQSRENVVCRLLLDTQQAQPEAARLPRV